MRPSHPRGTHTTFVINLIIFKLFIENDKDIPKLSIVPHPTAHPAGRRARARDKCPSRPKISYTSLYYICAMHAIWCRTRPRGRPMARGPRISDTVLRTCAGGGIISKIHNASNIKGQISIYPNSEYLARWKNILNAHAVSPAPRPTLRQCSLYVRIIF